METPKKSIGEWLYSNWFGILAGLASIVSVLIWFVYEEKPDLVYYVYPNRSVLVAAKEAGPLGVTLNGNPINEDVISVQMAFWNRGKKPIWRDDVLSPVSFRIAGFNDLLDVRLTKSSGEHTQLAATKSPLNDGSVALDWKVLENNDGGVLQVIYTGDQNGSVVLDGKVVGQPSFQAVIPVASSFKKYYNMAFWLVGGIIGLAMPLRIIWSRFLVKKNGQEGVAKLDGSDIFLASLLALLSLFLFFIFFMILWHSAVAPF